MINMVTGSLQFSNLGVAYWSISHRILMNFLHACWEAAYARAHSGKEQAEKEWRHALFYRLGIEA